MCHNSLTRAVGQNISPYLLFSLRSHAHALRDRMPAAGKLEACRKYQARDPLLSATRDASCDDKA